MKTLQAGFVGFLVSTVVLMVIAGGPGNAFSIVVLSIICTLGAGLLFWVPLWIGVGYLVLLMFEGVRIAVQRGGESDGPDDHDDLKKVKVRVKLHSHPALMEYIKRAKQAGIAENVLIDRLRTKGWNGDEIYEAFRSYKKLVKKRS